MFHVVLQSIRSEESSCGEFSHVVTAQGIYEERGSVKKKEAAAHHYMSEYSLNSLSVGSSITR